MTYITPHKALAHVDRLGRWKSGDKAAPVTVEWDLSNRCPLGCFACHFAHTHVRGPWTRKDRVLPMAFDSTGDLADPDVVRRGLSELASAGVRGVIWSGGGEPTTHPQAGAIVAYAATLGFRQGMYTYGGLMTDAAASGFAGLDWAVVSLDAADRAVYAAEKGVDAFDAACRGVRNLSAVGVRVGVSFLLHGANWFKADDMLALGRSLGASYVTFRPTIDTSPDAPATCVADRGWITIAEVMLRRIADEPDVECDADRFLAYRDWTGRSYDACHAIKLNATITPDGRVWVCPQRRGVRGSCVGDLTSQAFADLWQQHPGSWTDFDDCRVMCRLHLTNETIAPIFDAYADEAFV